VKIAFINGINSDGSRSTDLLCQELAHRGHDTLDVNYPRVHFWNAGLRRTQLDRAQRLVDATDDGDHVVAHSFGCLLVRRAMQLDRFFDKVFLFGPAEESDTYYPISGARHIYIIYNPYDKAIRWGMMLPNHDFGDMGRVGYRGPNDRRVDSRRDQYYSRENVRHGFYFQGERLITWADFVEGKVKSDA